MFAISGLGITLFLGGWTAPVAFLDWVPSWAWFFGKLMGMIFFFIWIRGTLPRLRMDQLMNFAWKFMLPMALINIGVAGLWHFLPPGILRWVGCALLLVAPYLALGRGVMAARPGAQRQYHYAE
jgi:NADH-quinone oxidoreductase subunit H